MRSLSLVLLSTVFSILLSACGAKEQVEPSDTTASYDVVSEGDASGVASTINAPGEVSPPALTATNVDTTTNLAIAGQPAAPTSIGGNLAGALPTTATTPAPLYIPSPNPPAGIMRRTPPGQVPQTQTYLPSTPRPRPQPPTDIAVPPTTTQPPPTTQPPTQTDTSQQQAPPPAKMKKDEPPSPPPPPDDTDTTSTNPG